MQTRAQAETGLVIVAWSLVLVIVLVAGSMCTFWARDEVVDDVMPSDDAVDWEAGFLAAALAKHPISAGSEETIAAYLSRQEIDTSLVSERLLQLVERVDLNTSERRTLSVYWAYGDQTRCVNVRLSRCSDFATFVDRSRDDLPGALSRRYDEDGGNSAFLRVPGERFAGIIVVWGDESA